MKANMQKRQRTGVLCVVANLAMAAALGCGKAETQCVSTVPAIGTITFKGQPIPGAFVTLHPKTPAENVPTPRASVGRDGTFEVTTFKGGDGAPEGEYVVTVQWYKPIKKGSDILSGPNVIPPKYSQPKTSDIVVRIAAGQSELKPIKL